MTAATLLGRLARLDTCAVSDALDRLGLPGAVTGILPQVPVVAAVSGRAVTVSVRPRTDDQPRPHLGAQAIAAGNPGDIIVIDHRSRLDVSSWGGILSLAAQERGIAGVVVDGACRDIDEARSLGFPVFARAAVPLTARGRIVEESWGEPVDISGVAVATGDLVIADSSGVVFVPSTRAEQIISLAERIQHRESSMAAAVRRGESIVDVMHDKSFEEIR